MKTLNMDELCERFPAYNRAWIKAELVKLESTGHVVRGGESFRLTEQGLAFLARTPTITPGMIANAAGEGSINEEAGDE